MLCFFTDSLQPVAESNVALHLASPAEMPVLLNNALMHILARIFDTHPCAFSSSPNTSARTLRILHFCLNSIEIAE